VHGGNQNCRCVGLSQKETYVHGGNQNHTCIGSIKTIHPQGWPEIYVHRVGPDRMCRVGQNHIFIRIYGVHTVFKAGKSPYIWSYTVYVYTVLANPRYRCRVNSPQLRAVLNHMSGAHGVRVQPCYVSHPRIGPQNAHSLHGLQVECECVCE
jgi:hypothetical protein